MTTFAPTSQAETVALREGLRELPDVTAYGVPLVLGEVDISHSSTTRCVLAAAVRGQLVLPVAALTFDPVTKTVEVVYVEEKLQRRGLATALWQEALVLCPDLSHSNERSAAGTAWAKAVGGPVPPVRRHLSKADGVGPGAALLAALFGLSPADLATIRA